MLAMRNRDVLREWTYACRTSLDGQQHAYTSIERSKGNRLEVVGTLVVVKMALSLTTIAALIIFFTRFYVK